MLEQNTWRKHIVLAICGLTDPYSTKNKSETIQPKIAWRNWHKQLKLGFGKSLFSNPGQTWHIRFFCLGMFGQEISPAIKDDVSKTEQLVRTQHPQHQIPG